MFCDTFRSVAPPVFISFASCKMSPRAEALITQPRSDFQQRLVGNAIPPRILIVGASTRAAAESVLRAGGTPVCADLFADADLQQIARIVSIHTFPNSLPDDIAEFEFDGWFYAGGLENAPDTLQRLEQLPGLGVPLGCTSASVRTVRDPWSLSDSLQSVGLPVLELRRESNPPPADGSWVRKPLAGAGGRSVSIWNAQSAGMPLVEPHYFQQRAAGDIASAVFTISSSGMARCRGVCRQLIGTEEAHAPHPFAWCGGIAPWPISTESIAKLSELGDLLAGKSGLRGLFGVDLAHDGEQFRVLEVNPRYPASAELFELSQRISLLAAVSAGDESSETIPPVDSRCVGKLVLYAPYDLVAPDWSAWARPRSPWSVVPIRDIPMPGATIPAGQPVCSVLATGRDVGACRRRLLARARRWSDRLTAARSAES